MREKRTAKGKFWQMPHKKIYLTLFFATNVGLLSCGRRDPYDTEGTGTWAQDPIYLAATLADSIELLTSGLSENSTSIQAGSTNLASDFPLENPINTLPGSSTNPQINAAPSAVYQTAQMACATATNTATVTATLSKPLEFTRPGRARQTSATFKERLTSSGSEARAWTRPESGDAYTCDADGRVNLGNSGWSKEDNVKGLKQTLTFAARVLKNESSVQKNGGTADLGAFESSTSGTVISNWDIPVPKSDATNFFNTKTVEFNITRTLKLSGNRGTSTLNYTARTKPESLLRSEVRRLNSTGAISFLFLQSGTLSIYDAEKRQTLELLLSSIKFDFSETNQNKCIPVDGNITGRIIPDGDVASDSFFLKFQDSLSESGISLDMNKTGAKDCEACVVRWCDFFQ
jgi:hypothetical protein